MSSAFGPVKRSRYLCEFLGTCFLILTIKLESSGATGSEFSAFGIGILLMTVIYQFGWISGAHFNPAVTTCLIIRGDLPSFPRSDKLQIIMYYCAQFFGGLAGGFLSGLVGGTDACEIAPSIDAGRSLSEPFFGEFFFTALLCSAVIQTGTLQDGNPFYGLTIGMTLFVSIVSIGNISGSCINPAVWFGLTLSATACGNESVQYEYFWVYLISEFLAATVVGLIYLYVTKPGMEAAKMGDGRGDPVVEMLSQGAED